jgi:DNA polymerase alpha-associated DNA helicase A
MDKTLARLQKCKNKAERRELYTELKLLRQELQNRERIVVHDILKSSRVVFSTLSGCASFHLKNQVFDTVIIDESSQAIEAGIHTIISSYLLYRLYFFLLID